MRVWFAGDGLSEPVGENWLFFESAGAYAAVRMADRGYHWGRSDSEVEKVAIL